MRYIFKKYEKSQLMRNHLNLGGENLHGERIDVTSLYIERSGEPWLGVMGEYHFVRDSRDRWYDELCKMKAGGITVAATYLFWIYHEEIEGEFDFSGDRDIRKFVKDAGRAGLDFVLRIGPWAHGECRNGGLPDWLLKKPYKLRDDNEGYLEKVRIWYTKIYEQVEGLLYKDGGNIIAIQLENELVDNAEHLLTLKRTALEVGLEAPIYTVTGWNSSYGAKIPVDDVLPVFGGYCDAPWAGQLTQLPLSPNYLFETPRNDSAIGVDIISHMDDEGWRLPYERYPYATCEIGAGLQPTHHRRPVVSGMDAYALALVKLGAGNNLTGYYMYHGGINKIGKLSTLQETKATGYPNDYTVLNYDFHAALSAYGETREQYRLLNMLHLFIHEWGGVLAPMEPVNSTESITAAENLSSLRYCMRTNGKSGFVFVNHYQRLAKMQDAHGAVIDTGIVTFPAIDVCGDVSFFMPFNMDLSGANLIYATAQPLCRVDNTYFFVELDGIEPVFEIDGDNEIYFSKDDRDEDKPEPDIHIFTLTWQQAKYARKISGKLYIGDNCDIYEADGEIKAVSDGSFHYLLWNGKEFEEHSVSREFSQADVWFEDIDSAPFELKYAEELNIGGERKKTWKKITVNGDMGFIEIPDQCDAAQIYADGELVADQFYCGEAWRIPAKLLCGKECYLVMSEMKDDFYREF